MRRFQTIIITTALSLSTVFSAYAAGAEKQTGRTQKTGKNAFAGTDAEYTDQTARQRSLAADQMTASVKTGRYQLGDQIENFTVTLTDGTKVDLYDLLKEKKGVLINLFASWCGPCKSEFPVLEKAYTEMQDEIGLLALSTEPSDTDQVLEELKVSLGLKNMPMGRDESGLFARVSEGAVPTSVMIDRNGTICLIHTGAITEAPVFKRLFSVFAAEPYETTLLKEIPEAEAGFTGQVPTGAELKAALCTDPGISFEDAEPGAWPFVPAAEGVSASNGNERNSEAVMTLTVRADAGDKLGYKVKTDGSQVYDMVVVSLGETPVKIHTGKTEWQDDYLTFPESGEQKVTFSYARSDAGSMDDTQALIKEIRLISDEEASAIDAAKPAYPIALEGSQIHLEVLSDLEDVVFDDPKVKEAFADEPEMRAVDDDEFIVRIMVGPEVNVDQAFVVDLSNEAHILRSLPTDDKGFLLKINDTEKAFGGYEYGFVQVQSSVTGEDPGFGYFMVFADDDTLEDYVEYLFGYYKMEPREEGDGWHMEENYYPRYYSLIEGNENSSSETEEM